MSLIFELERKMKKKFLIECLILFLVCSCHNTDYQNKSENSNKLTKQLQILKNMRSYDISILENSDTLTIQEHRELLKLKENFYYEISDNNMVLTVPGPSWELRGPLSIAQIEQEVCEEVMYSSGAPQVPFGFMNDVWIELKNQCKDNDEFYYFKSDKFSWQNQCGISGYVLIRKNKMVDMILGAMN